MYKFKKSFGIALSVLLLLSFSVTVLPLDFFHNHTETQQVCNEQQLNGVCTHKAHVNNKADFCWVCAIHFDKTFDKPTVIEKIRTSVFISTISEYKFVSFFTELIFTSLRGPPQNQ